MSHEFERREILKVLATFSAVEDADTVRALQAELRQLDRLIAKERNPDTGELARPGHRWERTIFGKWFQEAEGTPFACSPRSETYWSA